MFSKLLNYDRKSHTETGPGRKFLGTGGLFSGHFESYKGLNTIICLSFSLFILLFSLAMEPTMYKATVFSTEPPR